MHGDISVCTIGTGNVSDWCSTVSAAILIYKYNTMHNMLESISSGLFISE